METAKYAKKHSKLKVTLLVTVLVLLVCIVGCGVYLSSSYEPDSTALSALESDSNVTVTNPDEGLTVFCGPDEDVSNTYGLVFYPGAKVQDEAYSPLCHQLAAKGWTVVLVQMPFNMALFDVSAADEVIASLGEVEHWYVGGHSMGGAMAASYASDTEHKLEGLLLLAAYSTEDLSQSGKNVISLYGSKDHVLSKENYEKYRSNLPKDVSELVIEGGNHAQFGSYGPQSGDGQATIPASKQLELTVSFIDENK